MLGIVAGFGEPIGKERLEKLWANGYRAIRQDIQIIGGRTPRIMECLEDAKLWETMGGKVLWIVDCHTVGLVPEGSEIELYNEPDLFMAPDVYADRLLGQWNLIDRRNLLLWGCGISNCDVDSLKWMRDVLSLAPYIQQVSIHRYPAGKMQDRFRPHENFSSRKAEAQFMRVLAQRPFIVTETGYHNSRMWQWGFIPTKLTPDERRNCLRYEIDFWTEQGAQDIYLYQERGEYEVMSFGRLV